MNSLNSVLVEGTLIADPEKNISKRDTTRVLFIVDSVRFFSDSGQSKEEHSRFEVEVWNKTAELCLENLREGSGVRVVGRLKEVCWHEAQKKRSKIIVVGESVEFKSKFDKKPGA